MLCFVGLLAVHCQGNVDIFDVVLQYSSKLREFVLIWQFESLFALGNGARFLREDEEISWHTWSVCRGRFLSRICPSSGFWEVAPDTGDGSKACRSLRRAHGARLRSGAFRNRGGCC